MSNVTGRAHTAALLGEAMPGRLTSRQDLRRQPPGSPPGAYPYDIAAWLLLTALIALALLTFSDYAISNDEGLQHRYGELIVDYYRSGMTDRSVFEYKNLYLYGGLFDTIAVLLGRIIPADVFAIRHVMCAITGIGGLAAVWATGRLVAGPRAGLLALAALAVCGPWFGSMFNHTKDIPFAAAMMGATYFLIRASRDLPRPRLTDLALFGLLLGAALGQRALGLLLVFYVPIAIALYVPAPVTVSTTTRFVFRSLLLFVPALALGYLIMLAAWPWAALNLFNPVRGLFAFAQFQYPIETLLAGQTFLMAEVPRWYIPAYLAIKLPLIVLLGAGIAMLAAAAAFLQQRSREIAFVAFTAAFPVACQVITHGPSFSGLRHFLFVLPPIAVLAGIGFDATLAWLEARRKAFAIAAATAVTLALAWPASQLVRLHPFESLYFNELVGGLNGASTRYDTDYWVNSMHEMVAGLETYLDRERGQQPRQYYVAVCGERLPFEKEAEARNSRLRWAEGDQPADFFIAPTHNSCDTAVDGKVIVTVERLGVPIGVVKDSRTWSIAIERLAK
jgi:Dolichyl-phosphate-mannose-protein mannosyltransferase